MNEHLFKNVVGQCFDLGIRTISPFINGEPLADPRMISFIQWIASSYPSVEVGWFTNAALLGDAQRHGLLEAGNIHQFHVSVQGGTKKVFEMNTGLDFDKVMENVRQLVALKNQMKSPCVIRMVMCMFSLTIATAEAAKALARDLGVELCLSCFSNFGGMVTDEEGERPFADMPRLKCDRALHHVYVYWNGDVGQCCFDLNGVATYGNVNHSPLAEIFASEKHREMVDAHERIDQAMMPSPCRLCNSPRFHG